MKDVAICDKPRGADEQALIRGFPNAATQPCVARKFQIPNPKFQISSKFQFSITKSFGHSNFVNCDLLDLVLGIGDSALRAVSAI